MMFNKYKERYILNIQKNVQYIYDCNIEIKINILYTISMQQIHIMLIFY